MNDSKVNNEFVSVEEVLKDTNFDNVKNLKNKENLTKESVGVQNGVVGISNISSVSSSSNKRLLEFSIKQMEYVKLSTHRWNIKIGATQCGKTYIDTSVVIYMRYQAIRGLTGLRLIMGVSKSTIERNVLEPMRDFWGSDLVGEIKSDNTAMIFGQKTYCLGAEKSSQISKLRGAKVAYCYGDEVVDWNDEVFALLKSRLSLPYSICDLVGNPSNPTHEIKKFIDSRHEKGIDIYIQNWTLFDNPFLPKSYVEALCNEYAGTVYYDRYILGQWKRAEGVVYKKFADNPHLFIIDKAPPLMLVEVGVDFGGNKSGHTFVANGFTYGFSDLIVLEAEKHTEQLNPEELNALFTKFATKVYNTYGKAFDSNYDNAEPVLGRGLEIASLRAGCRTRVRGALKTSVNGRIRTTNRLLGAKRFWVMRHCTTVINALQQAVYNSKAKDDERLDNGTSDIDTLDAMEYGFERHIESLLRASGPEEQNKTRKITLEAVNYGN